MSALVTSRTKTIFRSKSAQTFIFLQLCREMYEFDEDGERYYEKGLYGMSTVRDGSMESSSEAHRRTGIAQGSYQNCLRVGRRRKQITL
jgi:hypothetical protein